MGRGSDPLSPLIQSRLRRTSTTEADSDSSEEEAPATDQNQTDRRSSNELTATQEQMLEAMGERHTDLPTRLEPEVIESSDNSDSIDPFEQRLQEKQEGESSRGASYSRPEVEFVSAPSSNYEWVDPTSTRTGLDTFDNLGRPLPGGTSEDDGFDVPSLYQGATKAGGPGYKATFDDEEGLVAPKTNGSFREEWPTLAKIADIFSGTKNPAGTTPKGEALDAAEKDIVDSSTPDPKPAPKKEEPPKNETQLERAVREAEEEAAARAAAEAAAAEAAAKAAAEAEKEKGGSKDPSQPPDEFVDPEEAMAFSEYLREQSGYTGPVRDGDITWDDQQKDSTGGGGVVQSDLYGDRPEGTLGKADIPDGPIVLGNDHDINWGPDANNPAGGLKEDVPANVGRAPNLSHLDPSNESDEGDRTADRTIGAAEETKAPAEGQRAAAEQEADRFTIVREAASESNTTMRAMSAGGETETVDLIGDAETGDESGDPEDDSTIEFTADDATSMDEGETTSIADSSGDDATIVYTPGDGQTSDTVTIDTGGEAPDESDDTEDDSTASATPVFTAVEGRVNVEDLRNLQPGRGFFDDEPADAGSESAGAAPEPEDESGEISDRFAALRSSDLRLPSPLDDIQPLRTFEPVGASDDEDSLPDEE